MRILRRSAIPAPPAPPAPSPTAAVSARRQIVRPKRVGVADEHKAKVLEAFGELDGVDAQLAMLSTRRAELEAQVNKHMLEGHLKEVTDGKFEAIEMQTKSRGSRTIDAHKFFDILAVRGEREEALAWEAMSVSATEAAKLLAKAELDRNFPMSAGTVTGTVIKINRIEVKVSKGGRK